MIHIIEVLNDKRTNRSYTAEFKHEAVALVTEQGITFQLKLNAAMQV